MLSTFIQSTGQRRSSTSHERSTTEASTMTEHDVTVMCFTIWNPLTSNVTLETVQRHIGLTYVFTFWHSGQVSECQKVTKWWVRPIWCWTLKTATALLVGELLQLQCRAGVYLDFLTKVGGWWQCQGVADQTNLWMCHCRPMYYILYIVMCDINMTTFVLIFIRHLR